MRVVAYLLICVLLACARDAGEPATWTVTDSAGIEIVESRAPAVAPVWARVEPEPLLRIGEDGEGPYQFGLLGHGLLLDDGRVAVTDNLAADVRIFDRSGVHVQTLGRRGEGPGEFANIAALFEYAGDTLLAFDQRLRRTTLLPLDAGTPRVAPSPIEENHVLFGSLDNGALLAYNPGQYRRGLAQGLQWDSTSIWRMDFPGDSARVIAQLALRELLIGPDGQRRMLMPERWAVHAASRDGFYWTTSEQYNISFYDAAGTLRRILRRPVEPRPVDAAMIDAWIEANLDRVRRFEGEANVPRYRQSYDAGERGAHVPLFGTAFVDRYGRLWLSDSTWPSLDFVPARWSVLSADGVWQGDVEAPPGLRIVDSRGDVVLGFWRDELDVPYVQLHRLVVTRP